jgi:hypothetical protein
MLSMQANTWLDANGGWVGLGALIVGLVGIILAIRFRPRQSKGLGWRYQSANRIIRVTPAELNKLRLRVVYGERNIDDPNIIVLRILNAGHQEIREDDFDRPITIEFKESQLLALDVIGQSSPSMEVSFKLDTSAPNRVTLNPLLLNVGDWLELQFVTDGDIEQPSIGARIAGQTMEPTMVPRFRPMVPIYAAIVGGLFGLALDSLLLLSQKLDIPLVWFAPGLLVLLLLMSIYLRRRVSGEKV